MMMRGIVIGLMLSVPLWLLAMALVWFIMWRML